MPQDIFSFVGQPLHVGTAARTGVTVTAGLNSILIKYSTGGSLEIGGVSLTAGNGYLFTVGEVLSFDIRGTFYMIATGSTATCFLLKGQSEGIPL